MSELPPPQIPAPPGLPSMRGRLVLMATLAAVSVYGTVTGPLEASPSTDAAVTEVPASTVAPTPTTVPVVAGDDATNPEDANPEDANPEDANPEDANPEDANPEDANPEDANPEDGNPEDAGATDAPADDGYTGVVQPGSPFTDDFESDAEGWRPVNGSWAVQAGTMVQSDPAGFDLINELMVELPPTYNVTVRMHAVGERLGGGVIVGMTTTGSRRGAYLIDFTAGGEFLRWGRYDVDTGIYKYLGGLNVGTDVSEWHTLRVKIGGTESTVFFNGDPMGTFDPVVGGHVALVTSEASVEFDDLVIEIL